VEQATIAYGYGVSVSLLQLAHAYLVFARDGDLVPVSVLRTSTPPTPVQVLSPATVAKMRHMLEMATSPEGTAPGARIQGYRVAGKTGTARKLRDGHYAESYVSSFVGFAPASDPRIVVAVMIDEPRGGRFYGADVAAPAFGAIAAGTLRAMQVPYDLPAVQFAQASQSSPALDATAAEHR
jgi:cell division protein FtsI (penicillin-binding protein 3)